MGNTLLRDTDVMSMAHSLEVRVPFLDHLLIEYVWSLPSPLKWSARQPKRLLLAAMGRDLPMAVVSRPKMGFTFPWATWIRGRLGDPIEATFAGRSSLSDNMIDRQQCRQLWTKFVTGTDDHDWSRVWALYVLCRWLDRLHAVKKPSK
jgi:asparagine synthase (glutamine-hydrolysing)